MKRKWIDKTVTVLGLSLSGIASAKYLSKNGAACLISEKRAETSADTEIINELKKLDIQVEMGGHTEKSILNSDIVVTSPGIPPKSKIIQLVKNNKIPLTSEIELAYFESSKPFIAITGTNGKTTTTKLLSEILTNAGYNAPVCGNIGIPAISLVENPDIDYFVTEVSSYQIATSPAFKPQIGIFLNYTPDHIDWHGDEEAYFKAKADLFTDYRSPIWSIFNACDPKIMDLKNKTLSELVFFGREMPGFSVYIQDDKIVSKNKGKIRKIIELNDIPLLGKHNYQNIMSAIAAAQIIQVDADIIKSSIAGFKPPEHRLEYVDKIDGIKYYNDSKATNCDSAICALKAFGDEKVVLIVGGRDKGTDLDELVQAIKKHAEHVVLIGEAADRFQESLEAAGYKNIYRAESLEKAIDVAGKLKSGSVLFAPACSSFDMFRNFEERGRVFKDYVIKKKTDR